MITPSAASAAGDDVSSGSPGKAGSARPPRRHRIRRTVALVVLVATVYGGVTTAQVFAADKWDHTRPADAAVVLGAAQYDGRPSAAYRGRLDHALELYRQGTVPVIVVTGGSAEGDRFTEAYAGLKYLGRQGVPTDDIVVVDDGTSTWESLAASTRVLRKQDIHKVLLVSDPYHSFRLEGIADEVGLEGYVSPARSHSRQKSLLRESGLVAVGRIIGYRRLLNIVE